ncbi:MAG: hypothetical protein PUE91_08540 [Clostridiales bacterium]|nr:hypothetical protein [Clostridiales bacterium]
MQGKYCGHFAWMAMHRIQKWLDLFRLQKFPFIGDNLREMYGFRFHAAITENRLHQQKSITQRFCTAKTRFLIYYGLPVMDGRHRTVHYRLETVPLYGSVSADGRWRQDIASLLDISINGIGQCYAVLRIRLFPVPVFSLDKLGLPHAFFCCWFRYADFLPSEAESDIIVSGREFLWFRYFHAGLVSY